MTSSKLGSRLSSRRRSDPGLRWVRVVIAVLATVGAIDTGSITLKKWGLLGALSCGKDGFFGCNGCEKVLASAWGSIAGQPLALFGFLAYLAILLMAVVPLVVQGEARVSLSQRSWWGMALLSTAMAVFSLVLVGVMLFGIRDCCPFCILSALISLALLVFSLVGGDWEDTGTLVFRTVITALLVGIVGLGWAASANRPTAITGKGVPPPVLSESNPAKLALADYLKVLGLLVSPLPRPERTVWPPGHRKVESDRMRPRWPQQPEGPLRYQEDRGLSQLGDQGRDFFGPQTPRSTGRSERLHRLPQLLSPWLDGPRALGPGMGELGFPGSWSRPAGSTGPSQDPGLGLGWCLGGGPPRSA